MLEKKMDADLRKTKSDKQGPFERLKDTQLRQKEFRRNLQHDVESRRTIAYVVSIFSGVLCLVISIIVISMTLLTSSANFSMVTVGIFIGIGLSIIMPFVVYANLSKLRFRFWSHFAHPGQIWYTCQVDFDGEVIVTGLVQPGQRPRLRINEVTYQYLQSDEIRIPKFLIPNVNVRRQQKGKETFVPVDIHVGMYARLTIPSGGVSAVEAGEIINRNIADLKADIKGVLEITVRSIAIQSFYQDLLLHRTDEVESEHPIAIRIREEFHSFFQRQSAARVNPLSKLVLPDRVEFFANLVEAYQEKMVKYGGMSVAADEAGVSPAAVKTGMTQLVFLEGAKDVKARTNLRYLVENAQQRYEEYEQMAQRSSGPELSAGNTQPKLIELSPTKTAESILRPPKRDTTAKPMQAPQTAQKVSYWSAGEMPINILSIEDNVEYYKALQLLVKKNGYEYFDVAISKEDALEKLQGNLYHILLVDINLVAEDDENIDGIEVLTYLRTWAHIEHYQVIVFSNRTQYMDLLYQDFQVNTFIDKNSALNLGDKFTEMLQHAIVKAGFNRQLMIGPSDESNHPEKHVAWLIDTVEIVPYPNMPPKMPSKARLNKEIEMVLRRLYNDTYSRIQLSHLPMPDFYAGFAKVRPISQTGEAITSEVIRVGSFNQIDVEIANYELHLVKAGVRQFTRIDRSRRATWMKGYVLTFPTEVDNMITLTELYQSNVDTAVLVKFIQHLFEACESWFLGEKHLRIENTLSEHYMRFFGLTLETQLARLPNIEALTFDKNGVLEVKPFSLQFTSEWRIRKPQDFIISTHGNLIGKNIWIEKNRTQSKRPIYLVDFISMGWGHALRDFVRLEADLKVNAVSDTVPLEDYRQLEMISVFGGNLETINPELKRIFDVTDIIRNTAVSMLNFGNISFHEDEYWCGLLFNMFDMMLNATSLERQKRAIVSTSVILEKLKGKIIIEK